MNIEKNMDKPLQSPQPDARLLFILTNHPGMESKNDCRVSTLQQALRDRPAECWKEHEMPELRKGL